MTAAVREFTAGSAMFTRHDAHTRHVIADFTARMEVATDAALLGTAAALERREARRHPVCAELRAIVDAELVSRHLSLANLAEVTA